MIPAEQSHNAWRAAVSARSSPGPTSEIRQQNSTALSRSMQSAKQESVMYLARSSPGPTSEIRQQNSTALSRSMQSAKQESVMYLERTSLSTFGIYSDMLLQPLFFPWTSALLSSSRITKLEITSWCTPRVTWSTLLCSVTMVKLEVLNLDCLSDSVEFIPSFVDLENFFTRHPRIHTLRLKSKSKQPLASTFTEAILPNLSSLSGHSIYIRSFLQMQQSHPDTLLHLKSVELMHFPSFFGTTFNYDIFDTALAQLAGFSGNNITLTLHITHPASAWFENHVDLGPSKSVLCHLTCVSHLVISSGFTQAMCARATLLDWLGLFPSVETVAFVGLSGEEETSLKDREFLGLVTAKCPRIKKIQVGRFFKSVGFQSSYEMHRDFR